MNRLKLLLFLFLGTLSYGQSLTTVTATISDPTGQTFNYGTVQADYQRPSQSAGILPLSNGVPFVEHGISNYTTMNGSGTFTINLANLSTVSPTGGTWMFTLCPFASASCTVARTQLVTGASVNLSTQLSAFVLTLVVNATPAVSRAYVNGEVANGVGVIWLDVTTNQLKYMDTSYTIHIIGGGGGTGNVTTTGLSSPYLPVASGTSSIVNSLFQDSGVIGSYGGAGGFGVNYLNLTPSSGPGSPSNGQLWYNASGSGGAGFYGYAGSTIIGPLGTGSVIWNLISNPTGNQNLTMDVSGYNSTEWNWANGTATGTDFILATSSSPAAVLSSPGIEFLGRYESSSGVPLYAPDYWAMQNVIGAGLNGTSTFTFTHSGSSGYAAVAVPNITIQGETQQISTTTPNQEVDTLNTNALNSCGAGFSSWGFDTTTNNGLFTLCEDGATPYAVTTVLGTKPGVVYDIQSSSVHASISPITMVATTSALHDYLFTWTASLTALGVGCSGTTTTVLNVIFTDPNASTSTTEALATLTIATSGNGTLGFISSGTANILAKTTTSVTYSTTGYNGSAAGCTTGPSYQITPVLIQEF